MRRIGSVIVMIGLLGGCESKPKDPFDDYFASQLYKDYVPLEAQPVTAGAEVLTYKAPQPGRVYVVDLDDIVDIKAFKKPRVVVVSTVDQNADVRFDPIGRQFEVSGQNLMKLTKVTGGHQHEMRFIAIAEKE
jgi:hypothetical protein